MWAIRLFGTTDSFNTEATKCLHIDFAKEVYQATNHKDKFVQMTRWLERKEKVLCHANFMLWKSWHPTCVPSQVSACQEIYWHSPNLPKSLQLRMTCNPSQKYVSLEDVTSPLHYNAQFFVPALTHFIALFNNPMISN